MDEKKPSTAEILAKIRAQKAAAAAPAASAPPAEPAAPSAPAAQSAPEVSAVAATETPAAAPVPSAPKPAAPVAKPGSTKDILAAIRAKGAGGKPAEAPSAAVPATPAAAPAAATVVAAAPAKTNTAPTGPLPSVAEMVRAARSGATAATAGTAAPAAEPKAKPVAPPMPAKPVPAAKKAPTPQRRGLVLAGLAGMFYLFATPFRLAWTACGVVTGIATLGTARFMFPNVLVEPPSKFKVGPASDYPLNSVSNKWKDQFGIWVVHTDQYQGKNLIFALQSVCTHLGCTPNWLDGEQKFKCPCHGSGFYITGVNFEGPAPRPLERMGVRVAEDGMLEVDKSMKFQEEMGQWKDPASFVDGELA